MRKRSEKAGLRWECPVVGVLLAACAAGCLSSAPDVKATDPVTAQAALNDAQARVYAVPPKQMVEKLQAVLAAPPVNLRVVKVEGNRLTTDWREYPGEFHIARRWQERTRFVITVVPDWQRPGEACTLQVAVETQQRHSPKAQWFEAPELKRPQRATALLRELSSQLSG